MPSTPTSPDDPLNSSFIDQEAEEQLEVDLILQSLAHSRRREILSLLDGDPVWTRVELIEHLLDIQDDPGATSRTEIEANLAHRHLPKLEEAKLISLQEDAWLIEQGESYSLIRDMADAASSVMEET